MATELKKFRESLEGGRFAINSKKYDEAAKALGVGDEPQRERQKVSQLTS